MSMNSNGILEKHWLRVSFHFLIDALLFFAAFASAIRLRFGEEGGAAFGMYLPSLMAGALVCAATIYICRLYAPPIRMHGPLQTFLALAVALGLGLAVVLAASYLLYANAPGRGVLGLGGVIGLPALLGHHGFLRRSFRSASERVAFLVGRPTDEEQMRLLMAIRPPHLALMGVIEHCGYQVGAGLRVIGRSEELEELVFEYRLNRIFCSEQSLMDPAFGSRFCQLRYSGVTVMSLITLCEEVDQCVPLELLTAQWLLHASGEPHLLYIQKVKRLFDIAVASFFIAATAPLLLAAMVAVKLTSPGPVFFRQSRSGRFGRSFRMVKLRTMVADAERAGPVWTGDERDPRVTPVGRFLRRYRIDELPQLFNVLVGEMSFVGPRPERPELIKRLAHEIPFYRERLLVQPGITGWAQVNYPYGASVADAGRKLEYDLYYMKHMSVFLDLFILLDTVRIVLTGGIKERVARPAYGAPDGSEGAPLEPEEAAAGVAPARDEIALASG